VKTATNKWLLISESRGDSNRCTPCRGKLDQHVTYAFHASPRTPGVCFLRAVPVRGNLSWVINRVEQAHCSREEGLLTQSTAHHWPIRGSVPSFSLEPANEAVGAKPSIYQRPATRLTGPISPVCDRYVQYLFAGANRTVLNQHRRGLQPWRCRFSTYHSLTFPTSCLPFPLVAPPGLHLTQFQQLNQSFEFLENLWPPRGFATTWPFTVAYIYV
jgi:hypothetical protein